MKIFISHAAAAAKWAVSLKVLLKEANPHAEVFLSSDWESIPAGAVWLQAIEAALTECDYFFALIATDADAKRLWVNYEVGFVRGRHLLPKILVFSGVDPKKIEYPLIGLQLLMHGDTNRWHLEFSQMGLHLTPDVMNKLGALFEFKWHA
jgi:hypothetical protein